MTSSPCATDLTSVTLVARRSTSRATELLFIAEHSTTPEWVLQQFRIQPDGGTFHDGKTHFEWGNVKTLVSGRFHRRARLTRITDSPKHVYHLDRLPRSRRATLEEIHALPRGSISGSLSSSKADVLVVDTAGGTYLVSFKESEGQAKLGQVSADTTYGAAALDGGIDDLDIATLPVPAQVLASDTELDADSFKKLSSKDQKLAYYKKHHASSWKKYVDERSELAKINLRKFAGTMTSDRSSFLDFIGSTLAGASKTCRNFYIVLGDEVIQLHKVLENLATPRWSVQASDASTVKKHAVLLKVSDGRSTYALTRIEQSFEGARPDVSQTKGIIFHFQQHPKNGMNYKQLLLDLR